MALVFTTETCAMTSCGSVCRTSQAGVVTSCPRGCKKPAQKKVTPLRPHRLFDPPQKEIHRPRCTRWSAVSSGTTRRTFSFRASDSPPGSATCGGFRSSCFDNGGGAFLFVYLLVIALVAKPLYYLEMFVGQFSSSGSMSVWAAFPLARGVGATMTVGSLCLALYYNMYLSYALMYIYHSLGAHLPWSGCYSSWGANTHVCYIRKPNV
ncbi:hypothetical protein MTO96_051907 [Rhipicephalus appendiculatus]